MERNDHNLPLNKVHVAIAFGGYILLVCYWMILLHIENNPWKYEPISPVRMTLVQIASFILTLTLIFLRARYISRLAAYYIQYGLWGRVALFVGLMIVPVGDVVYMFSGRPAMVFSIFYEIPKISATRLSAELKKVYYTSTDDAEDYGLMVVTPIGDISALLWKDAKRVDLFLLGEDATLSPDALPPNSGWIVDWSQNHDAYAYVCEINYHPSFSEVEIAELIIRAIDKLRRA